MNADSLAEFPRWVVRTSQVLATQARAVPGPGQFAFVEHVWHLAELEVEGFALRLKRLRTEDEPRLDDFDGDQLARDRDYRSRSLEEGLEAFTAARAQTCSTLRQIRGPALLRSGFQRGVGRVVLRELPGRIAAHDRAHALELLALLERLSPGSALEAPLRAWVARIPAPVTSPCGTLATQPPAGPTVVPAVQRAVLQRLPEGPPTLRHVGSALGLSPRTLQRRLKSLGLSLQCLLDEARMTFALEALCDRVPLVRVAMDAGYSDRRALRRAVKRWTRQGPASLRC